MNSISPYTIRCYDSNSKEKRHEDRYSALGKIGQFDAYRVLKEFIEPRIGRYENVAESRQIYRFHDFLFDDAKRQFFGWLQAGSYGSRTDIINIETGAIDFTKAKHNAEMINHYVRFYIPAEFNEGIALLHNYKNCGIKTLLHDILKSHFSKITGRIIQMNPLAYEKAYNEWQDASAKEMHLVKFKGLANLEDQIARLGHGEQTLIIKSSRKKSLGRLRDYFTKGSEQMMALEVLTPLCTEVKTIVEIGGRKRTFRLGSNPGNQLCEIELDEQEVPIIDDNPDPQSLDRWCSSLLQEFATTLYPGMRVKT